MYTLYQCFNLSMTTTEGFGDATPKPAEVPTNVDTNNSIKTLAQLATDLQSGGGLKVPGDLNVLGGSLVASSSGDQKSSKLSINADGIGYTFYVNPSKYTGGGGLDANHLQIYSYGGSAGISAIMHMWPGGVNVPGKFFAGGKDIVGEIMGLRNDLTNLRNELTAKVAALDANTLKKDTPYYQFINTRDDGQVTQTGYVTSGGDGNIYYNYGQWGGGVKSKVTFKANA